MATTKGVAISWGLSTTGDGISGFTGAVTGGYTLDGVDYGREASKNEIKDQNGETKTQYFYDGKQTCSLKGYFSGSSLDITKIPAVGETVTVSGNANINGNWVCDSCSVAESNESHVTFDLSLSRADGITYS